MHKKIYRFFHGYYHKHYHGIYRHAKKLFAIDLFLLALALVMFASSLVFFFWKPGLTDLVDLSISLGGERLKSGSPVHLTVDYGNRSKYKLQKVTLALRLPNGFIVDREKTPESVFSASSIFNLPDLTPGAKGQVGLYGWFWGTAGNEERIVADLSYTPESFNSSEQKLSSFLANLAGSMLRGGLTLASSSFPNLPLPLSYTLTNDSDRRVENISLLTNWAGKINIDEKLLHNFSLEPHETRTITGTATTPAKTGKYSLKITPQIVVNNQPLGQLSAEKNVDIFFPNLASDARLLQDIPYAQPGQTIQLELSWANTSQMVVKNLRLKVAFTAGVVDLKATAREGNFKAENGQLIIDSFARTALSSGNPGGNDKFTITLKLLPGFSLEPVENAYLEIKPIMEAEMPEVPGQKFGQEGNPIKIPLATEVSFKAEARYYTDEGDQLGRGPLPPAVGETTKYWIMVRVDNTSNAINTASFSTELPAGVEFTGKQSVSIGPELKYNAVNHTVTWSYNLIPANSQTGLYFEVAVTPTADQAGKNLQLTKAFSFSATDDFINKEFDLAQNGLTNVLPASDLGRDKGAAVTP